MVGRFPDGRVTIGVGSGVPTVRRSGLSRPHHRSPDLPFDAFARTEKIPAALPKAPKGARPPAMPNLLLPLRRFRPVGKLIRTGSDQTPRIQFPLNGSRIDVDRSGGGEGAPMPVKVAGRRAAADHHAERYLRR